MKMDGNFKVKCVDDENLLFDKWCTKGDIYEFIDGQTIWDNETSSSVYKDSDEFLKLNNRRFELVEEYPLTIQDVFKYPTNTKFEVRFSDGSKMCHKIRKELSHLVDDETNEIEYFSEYLLNARFKEFKIKQKEKKYIELLQALELIKNRQEVCCEYDNKFFKFNNTTKKIRIDFILNGKWYVME